MTYGGLDYLALYTFMKRKSAYSIGNQIGVGKESDIYVVADETGTQRVLKIHRLGRISFRSVKNNRDYLRKRNSASWMYMSRLAAEKEYAFLKVHRSSPPTDPFGRAKKVNMEARFSTKMASPFPSPWTKPATAFSWS